MILDIPKPKISPRFDVEDIRKLRDWKGECWQKATWEEIRANIDDGAERVLAHMEELRSERRNNSA